ncbi:hypothetical protein M430DRAFT_99887 [Amorphotheca resinae ATCC 22711]|uniref:MARVEL domain-containing protein n=1 Tax=Amorphotheca resinae ATCC 22711 TaxID=857342 RepID=A0A2T3B496_AMORE|nr:hypothetical protein M430DRAFT_99887 [Amorphotheca resinae ATCC 22711]PSS20463.1 hypothetical protein M430DRAFT_99887 [Amorphotheca resinae ATCC 22711]
MASLAQLILRSFQFLWTLLTSALIGNVLAMIYSTSPASVNYCMFVSAFSYILVLYGFAAAIIESIAIPVVLIVADTLGTIFSMVAGIVLAARLRCHSCSNHDYLRSTSVTINTHHPEKQCRQLQASTAFFWFLFACFAGSLILDIMGAGRSMSTRRAGVRKPGPAMAQV